MIRPGDSDSESRHSKLSGAALNSVAAAAAAASERRNPAATRNPGPQAAARPCQWTGPVPGFWARGRLASCWLSAKFGATGIHGGQTPTAPTRTLAALRPLAAVTVTVA